jgi:NADH oxidase (H2O2-forming)
MHIVIIGNGVAGITAARYIRKMSDHDITVISAESRYFFSRTALMYVYMGHMRFEDIQPYETWFWEKNRINLVQAFVQEIDTKKRHLALSSGQSVPFDKLIIATGSQSNNFGWPGQDLLGVQGLYNKQDLENMELFTQDIQHAVIVGGGLIGIEMAEMLRSRDISVTLLVRETNYWDNVLPPEESKMVSRHIREHHINLQLQTELKEILPDENGRVKAVITNKGEQIDCGFVGLTAGVHPNIDIVKDTGIETQRGILVDKYLQTNIEDIYAIGDCAQLKEPPEGRRLIEAVWYVGKYMGKTVAHSICKSPTSYEPGIWYNSAKFLDIEYQVYGYVPNQFTDKDGTIYWEHKDGKKSIRLVYDKDSLQIRGFNLMGIRFRHNVCDKLIAEKWPLKKVVAQLNALNFDPEFFSHYEKEIVKIHNEMFANDPVKLVSGKPLQSTIYQ